MKLERGSIVQINETFDRKGWIGCIFIVNEVTNWGVKCTCPIPNNDKEAPSGIPMRLKTGTFDLVGRAALTPEEDG